MKIAVLGLLFGASTLALLITGAPRLNDQPKPAALATGATTAIPLPLAEAVRNSVAMFPAQKELVEVRARSAALSELREVWYAGGGMPDWDDNWTVWIVLIMGSDLHRDEVVEPPNMQIFQEAREAGDLGGTVAGGYYIWNQGDGALIAYGVIDDETNHSRFTRDRMELIGESVDIDSIVGAIRR